MTTIKQGTFDFLEQLKENNNREWFQENKAWYEEAKQNVEQFTEEVLSVIKETDQAIPSHLTAKKCILRIYRDIRFSKNKTPYKTNFGISISSGGKATGTPGYYLHIEPNKSFIAGGYWAPEASDLKAMRQEIDYNTSDFLKIIESKEFKDYFGGLEREDTLKFAPKGYDADHPHIALLKLKSFVCVHEINNKSLKGGKGLDEIAKGIQLIFPFNQFLQNALV
jgi:uncharacterized protein (TIGR02453 family)